MNGDSKNGEHFTLVNSAQYTACFIVAQCYHIYHTLAIKLSVPHIHNHWHVYECSTYEVCHDGNHGRAVNKLINGLESGLDKGSNN